MRWIAEDESGNELTPGQTIHSKHRNEPWKFVGIDTPPSPGRSGKLLVEDGDGFKRTLFPTVFDVIIRDADHVEDPPTKGVIRAPRTATE